MAETLSRDTFENARQTAELLTGGPFVLVTSASHMARSLAVFHRLGLDPIPAPTDYLIADPAPVFWYLPSLKALEIAHIVLHEYLGLVWYKLCGWI
ncbi:MAG: YdcF family protein [Deltaproteobacteria bacterium]|nr:YdcF family protein [Deltaproteobacteria bacterium]